MIPRWKIARELDRTTQQLKAVAGLVWEPFVQRRHDRNRGTRLKITPGSRPLRDRVLIYLIYQPDRILESTIETCRLLEEQGYSTLVVSNSGLKPESLARLKDVSWQVMERPNYGYDFGGYRDGILYLMDKNLRPEWLLVMNDSVWYPVGQADTLVRRLEGSGLDVSGTIVHRSFRKTLLRRRATRVIESYLFLFNRKALESAAFRNFWVKYRLSSNKYNAVHRGERQVAEQMLAAGLSADGLFGRDEFITLIEKKDAAYLRLALLYSNSTTERFVQARDSLLAEFVSSDAWKVKAISHIRMVTAKHSFFASFPFVAAGEFGIPVVKRTSGAMQVMARRCLLSSIDRQDLPAFRGAVMSEMRRYVQSGTLDETL